MLIHRKILRDDNDANAWYRYSACRGRYNLSNICMCLDFKTPKIILGMIKYKFRHDTSRESLDDDDELHVTITNF